jgi:hypothetical protein
MLCYVMFCLVESIICLLMCSISMQVCLKLHDMFGSRMEFWLLLFCILYIYYICTYLLFYHYAYYSGTSRLCVGTVCFWAVYEFEYELCFDYYCYYMILLGSLWSGSVVFWIMIALSLFILSVIIILLMTLCLLIVVFMLHRVFGVDILLLLYWAYYRWIWSVCNNGLYLLFVHDDSWLSVKETDQDEIIRLDQTGAVIIIIYL